MKCFSLPLSVLLCLALVGCAVTPATESDTPTAPTAPETEAVVIETPESTAPETEVDTAAVTDPTSADPTTGKTTTVRTTAATKPLYREPPFFFNLGPHTKPKNLLVIVFNYNNGYYETSDEELAQAWSDYVFGTDNGEPSVNGYFREVSQGKFWFDPIRVGDNTTGVHVVHLDKDYSDAQMCHNDYPFFDFSYDAALVLDDLAKRGLDVSRFKADGINSENYVEQMIQYFDSSQDMRPSQWYDTDALMFVFPPINTEKVDLTPLSTAFNDFGLYCHVNQNNSLGTIVHELSHTLGAVDVYNYCNVLNDLMSVGYDKYETDATAHIDPYYKLLWGWCEATPVTKDATVKLYPATSSQYAPVLIPTDDPHQYFLIENRQPEGYDGYIASQADGNAYAGVSVWRVDKTALEKIYSRERKGISMECVLAQAGESCGLQYYAVRDDLKSAALKDCGIAVTFEKEDPDYIEVKIEFQR